MPSTLVPRHVSILRVALALVAALVIAAVIAGPARSVTFATNMWLTPAEAESLPLTGTAWNAVKAAADGSLGTANISDQNSSHDVNTLAVALVYARTGTASYRAKAAGAIAAAIGTEAGGRTLALARNLTPYVLAADLIDLPAYDAALDARFRTWLSGVRRANLSGMTLVSTHERRANNWGTNAGASRIAADIYLRDTADLAAAVRVYRGWLGDRALYAGFDFGDLSWQADASKPVGINPKGATRNGYNIDGVLPDDQRRAGGFTWPAPKENYVWGALGPALVTGELLRRAGYADVTSWSDSALRRSLDWLHGVNGFPASGDDSWVPWLANRLLGTSYPAKSGTKGKPMAWTDWTHGGGSSGSTTSGTGSTSGGSSTGSTSGGTSSTGASTGSTSGGSGSTGSTSTGSTSTGGASTGSTSTGSTSTGSGQSGTTSTGGSSTGSTSTGTGGGTTTGRTIAAVADAPVDSGEPTRNFGRSETLRARADAPVRRTYLKFDVSELTQAPASAKLRLYVTDDSVGAISIQAVTGSWDEAGITWDNAPAPTGAVVGSGTPTAGWIELDLGSAVSANGTYTFVITTQSTNGAKFASRETATAPMLVLG